MKAIAAILALSCVLHCATASVSPVDCPGGPSRTCNVNAGLSITTTQGSCSGVAKADCKVWTQSENVYVEQFKIWYSDPSKICDSGTINARAVAVARAIAKVYASTFVSVTCTGTGFACGFAFSAGEGFARSIAEALAFAAADASIQVGSDAVNAFCFADIRAIGGAFASAATKAFSQTCTSGGTAEAWENTFAGAIGEVVAAAFAQASAGRCIEEGDVTGDVECRGNSFVNTSGRAYGRGDFCAGTGGFTPCSGQAAGRCCGQPAPICAFSGCPGCQLPWNREPGSSNIWRKNDGTKCKC